VYVIIGERRTGSVGYSIVAATMVNARGHTWYFGSQARTRTAPWPSSSGSFCGVTMPARGGSVRTSTPGRVVGLPVRRSMRSNANVTVSSPSASSVVLVICTSALKSSSLG
jgi:hypothetical protein